MIRLHAPSSRNACELINAIVQKEVRMASMTNRHAGHSPASRLRHVGRSSWRIVVQADGHDRPQVRGCGGPQTTGRLCWRRRADCLQQRRQGSLANMAVWDADLYLDLSTVPTQNCGLRLIQIGTMKPGYSSQKSGRHNTWKVFQMYVESCRQNAAECLRLAHVAEAPQARFLMVQIARVWLSMAAHSRQQGGADQCRADTWSMIHAKEEPHVLRQEPITAVAVAKRT
jgi:hypothetical protein